MYIVQTAVWKSVAYAQWRVTVSVNNNERNVQYCFSIFSNVSGEKNAGFVSYSKIPRLPRWKLQQMMGVAYHKQETILHGLRVCFVYQWCSLSWVAPANAHRSIGRLVGDKYWFRQLLLTIISSSIFTRIIVHLYEMAFDLQGRSWDI